MKKWYIAFLVFYSLTINAQEVKTIHVFVALCDNVNQGIVPVPATLGNGEKPQTNLYWGAAYGVKSFLKYKAKQWILVKKIHRPSEIVLERLLFKHRSKNAYLLADAYKGAAIKNCTEAYLKALNSEDVVTIHNDGKKLSFGGAAQLLAYIGHDGLMEFSVSPPVRNGTATKKEAIILACFSKRYFKPYLQKLAVTPVLWTTNLMAPEAYTLVAAIDAWLNNKSNNELREQAAQAYHKYQKCGIRGARRLLVSGF